MFPETVQPLHLSILSVRVRPIKKIVEHGIFFTTPEYLRWWLSCPKDEDLIFLPEIKHDEKGDIEIELNPIETIIPSSLHETILRIHFN